MTESFFHIVTNRMNTVLALGFAYGATIVFTFFGPALMRNSNEAGALALVAVICHVLAFYLPPLRPGAHPGYFPALYAALLPLLLCFPRLSLPFQTICVGGYAWMVGRIGCFWTYKVIDTIAVDYRGRTICCALFVSFSLLYIVNLIQPMLPAASLMGAPAVMSGLSVFFFRKMQAEMICPSMPGPKKKKAGRHLAFLGFLLVVYISGGFSYAGIYPSFQPYSHIDRFYNVLFFLVGLSAAGTVLDFWGRKIAFSIGVALLGIAFTFFVLPPSLATYFLSQTFLQAGWAFVNAFGWSFSWDMAIRHKKPRLFSMGISAMLLGAAAGGVLSEMMIFLSFDHKSIYGLFTFIPLFISIGWLGWFPETLKPKKALPKTRPEELEALPLVAVLTSREKEVLFHMLGGLSNAEIGLELFISESTVKTHVGRVYAKLGIPSKRSELRRLIFDNLKINKNLDGLSLESSSHP